MASSTAPTWVASQWQQRALVLSYERGSLLPDTRAGLGTLRLDQGQTCCRGLSRRTHYLKNTQALYISQVPGFRRY
ncbi:MAG: hypothetical protein Ct9H300mP14_16340 [Gammaproteobacteria bacterium]|nr:MAG: hypothetical protein Ct9H300mP14_16340 [Gammaproteobacteria bacterium]